MQSSPLPSAAFRAFLEFLTESSTRLTMAAKPIAQRRLRRPAGYAATTMALGRVHPRHQPCVAQSLPGELKRVISDLGNCKRPPTAQRRE
ncbi:MAG: hypothetical protein U0931_28810 [Vulcanimicrobiota bacterium]